MQVIGGAAVVSIILAFVGPLSALIATIPPAVIGGVTFLLYGMIGTSGLRLLVDQKVDYAKSKNLILTSVVLVAGFSGMVVERGMLKLSGMSLAAAVGLLLGIVFFLLEKANLDQRIRPGFRRAGDAAASAAASLLCKMADSAEKKQPN